MGQSLIGDFTGHICVAQEIISLSDSCQEQQCLLASSSFPTSECNVACDYCFEHKEPKHLGVRRKALTLLLAQIIFSW